MRFIALLLFLFLVGSAYAARISSPPALTDEPVNEQDYFSQIYQNWQELEVFTTNPDGNIRGDVGRVAAYNNSGTWKIVINTDGGTTWLGSASLTSP